MCLITNRAFFDVIGGICEVVLRNNFICAQIVRVKVTANQAKYFESLPLHSSQEIEDSNERFTIFKYYIDPTFDFKQELLAAFYTM